jgi:ABC-type oligopeptide transport system substrate-binding subunit
MRIYSEIKKYLLFLVGFFCLVIVAHIVLLYIYHDAEKYPLPGGTINVGMIGDRTDINVLNFDTKIENDPNDTVLRFIFRGLVRFSPTDKKIVNDLANCDIDKFPVVRCTLSQNALWSDGSSMTTEDVISSYAFFREKSTNEYTKSQLKLVDISEDTGDIVFRFTTRDVTAIQTLFLPILRKKDITTEWNGLIHEKLSFSGPYIYKAKEDKKETLFLPRNPYYTHTNRPFYFDQVRFGFGLTNKEITRVINPDILLSDTPVNTKNGWQHPYIRPAFYGAFMNTNTLPVALRRTLFTDILATINTEDVSLLPQENIFLGDIPNTPRASTENTFFQTVFGLWYSFGGTFQAPENTPKTAPKKVLTYITAPENTSPSFIGAASFDVRGNAPAGTTKVIVNDYTLKNFSSRKRTFSYTAKKEFWNLTIGQNIFRISFYGGNKILAEESITIYHSTDSSQLNSMKSEWEKANTPVPDVVVAPKDLDPKKLYNREGKVLSFRIVVQSDTPYLSRLANATADKLREFGTEVVVEEIPLTDIKKNLSDANFSYDILFSGVHLGLFYYNVSPFLHSNGIKNWYNLIRLKDSTLDTLLNRLTERLYYNAPDRLREIQINIQKILERESAVFTFWSPYEYIATKNTLLGLKIPEFMAGREMLIDVLSRWYFKEGYKRTNETKSIFWFFEWLKNELFPST